jgi:hypothetical protein
MDDCLKPISKMIYADAGQCCGIGADDYRLEQAFDDVMQCVPMLRHVCNNSGHDAAWISEGFARWCERKKSQTTTW